MLITCPSCAARYDVAPTLIAAKGRHVQCTACHTRWFERPPAGSQAADLAEEEILARLEARGSSRAHAETLSRPEALGGRAFAQNTSLPEPGTEGAPRPAAPHLRLVEPQTDQAPTKPPSGGEADSPSTVPDGGAPGPEPEEEAAGRSADADSVRDTTGPDAVPATAGELREAAPAPSGRPRLDLSSPPPTDPAPDEIPKRQGKSGLKAVVIALVIAAILALLYLTADRLAAGVPALQPVLTEYVSLIESGARDLDAWLDGMK